MNLTPLLEIISRHAAADHNVRSLVQQACLSQLSWAEALYFGATEPHAPSSRHKAAVPMYFTISPYFSLLVQPGPSRPGHDRGADQPAQEGISIGVERPQRQTREAQYHRIALSSDA